MKWWKYTDTLQLCCLIPNQWTDTTRSNIVSLGLLQAADSCGLSMEKWKQAQYEESKKNRALALNEEHLIEYSLMQRHPQCFSLTHINSPEGFNRLCGAFIEIFIQKTQ